jgi:ParB family chromosome partitioning protein
MITKPDFADVVEEAEYYQRCCREEQLTQDECAKLYKTDRSRITNLINLLKLPPKTRLQIKNKNMSYSQARELVKLANSKSQQELLHIGNEIVEKKMPVVLVRKFLQKFKEQKGRGETALYYSSIGEISYMEQQLREKLHTRIKITGNGKRGEFVISYFTEDDMCRIWECIKPKPLGDRHH